MFRVYLLMKSNGFNLKTVSCALLYSFLIVTLITVCNNGVPSFDGAMHLQGVANLFQNGQWALKYDNGVNMEIGIPFLFPVWIFLSVFGKSVAVTLIANALFILSVFIVLHFVIHKLEYHYVFFLILATIVFSTPFFFEYGFGVYGEIPALSFFLMSISCLLGHEEKEEKWRLGLAGCLMALSFMTKTVLLIGLAGYIVVFVDRIYQKKITLRRVLFFFSGLAIPLALFEIIKLLQFDSFSLYVDWWLKELKQIAIEAGVKRGFSDTENIIIKIQVHMSLFFKYFGFHAVLASAEALYGTWYLIKKIKCKIELSYIDIILVSALIYYLWWMLVTPTQTAWARRILNGVLLLNISLVFHVIRTYFGLNIKYAWNGKAVNALCLCALLIFCLLTVNVVQKANTKEREEVIALCNAVTDIKKKYSHAVFCGFGWWQAPNISFFSDTDFSNLYLLKKKHLLDFAEKQYYLVVDHHATALAKNELEELLKKTDNRLIYHSNDNRYRLYRLLRYSNIEKPNYTEGSFFSKKDDYPYQEGFYAYEPKADLRWSQKRSMLFLKYNGQSQMRISYYVSDFKTRDKSGNFTVLIDGVKVYQRTITQSGIYTDTIPLTNMVKGIKAVDLYFDSRVISEQDERELSYCIEYIGFER